MFSSMTLVLREFAKRPPVDRPDWVDPGIFREPPPQPRAAISRPPLRQPPQLRLVR